MKRSDAWFARQAELCARALAEADREHTPDEIAAAEAALAVTRGTPQSTLFTAAPHAGVATGGQPEPAGLASAPSPQACRRSHASF